MLPERIPPAPLPLEQVCAFAGRWLISQELAAKLCLLAAEIPYELQVISGWRSTETQQGLLAQPDSMATSVDRSTHTSCPAAGADLWTPTVTPVPAVKAAVGAAAVRVGLRWGGGSPIDPGTGIPKDWNHVDLGPRR